MEKVSSINFPALTGVRFVAALMVYVHHFNPFKTTIVGKDIHYFFDGFHVGVTLFFVLSGFLITHRYYNEKVFNFKSYLQKRFARIYPMYFILTSATFIVGYFTSQSFGSFATYLSNISFLKGYFDDLKFTGIPQGWTLTVEETFYFLAPLFFIFIKRSKKMLVIIPLLFLLMGFFAVQLCKNHNFHGFMGNLHFMLDYTFFGRIFEFFVGIALALILKKKYRFRFKNFTLIGIIGIILSIYLLSSLEQILPSNLLLFQKSFVVNFLLPVGGIMPFFYGLITEDNQIRKVLSSKFFILLGKSSYVFYLIHMGFIRDYVELISTNYLVVLVTLNILAITLYVFLEKPMNDFLRKI